MKEAVERRRIGGLLVCRNGVTREVRLRWVSCRIAGPRFEESKVTAQVSGVQRAWATQENGDGQYRGR